MSAQPQATTPDAGIVFQALTSYQIPMALKGALELDIFTHISEGATTPAQIAPLCQGTEKGVRVLCDFLTVKGFLTKQDGHYALDPRTAMFLDKKSPAYLGSVANFLTHDILRHNFDDVAALVRKGGAVFHSTLTPEDPVWVEFARSMVPMMGMPAQSMAAQIAKPGDPVKVLDIAAGHGIFGISVAKFNPVARIVALDWRNVLEVAQENAASMGVADRFSTIAGSAFEVDLGSDYDIVLLPNFLHHFDEPACVTLLKKIRPSLKPSGIVATIEFVPNEDRVTPPIPAGFAMMMLGGTDAGDAYTFADLDRMFRAAGFGPSEIRSLAPAPSSLIVTKYA